MALNGHEVVPYLAVDDTEGTAQPDPNDSLGGNRSGTPVYDLQSSLTSAQGQAREFIDTTQIGAGADVHVGKYAVFMTGPAAVHAARVDEFDTATGRFVLRTGTPSLAGSGDFYRLHAKGEFWDAVDGTECAAGTTQYRLLFLHNETGINLSIRRVLLRFLDSAGVEVRVAEWDGGTDRQGITVIADEFTAPDLDELEATPATANNVPEFEQPVAELNEVPRGGTRGMNVGIAMPVWLERSISELHRQRQEAAVQIIHTFSNAGGDPDPLTTSMVILFDLDGFTNSATLERDRALRINGGARYIVTLTAAETSEPVPGEAVSFELTTGPGTVTPNPDPLKNVTNDAGEAFVSYESPTDQADTGDSVTVTAEV